MSIEAQETVVMDVRAIPPRERHPRIFNTIARLAPGETLRIVNDHDPKPLYYQLMAERPGQVDWEYLESGPEVWQVRITRLGPQAPRMKSTAILKEEHDAVLVVLDQLERAAAAAARGVPVPKDIFTDVEEFFTVFVDRCHHGKEEATVFQLLESAPRHRRLVRRLADEHLEGRQLSRAFSEAVAAYVPGDRVAGQRIQETALAYGALLREHIDEENERLFAVMERELS
ncbi:MAG: DUF2249 domain-containing protein, partial [Thermomicrobiaceae bacterium]|nr:DUF2249 domain-containing protein [Thermomicrobiaceae bacterium]